MKLHPGQLFGEILKTHVGNELRLTETLCPPRFTAPRHSHELFQFCFILKGGFSETCGHRTRECEPLTLITHPSGEGHANQYYAAGAHCFVIEIEQKWLERIREYSAVPDGSTQFNYGFPVWLAKRLYQEFYRMDGASSLAIEGLTLEMMAEASRSSVKASERTSPPWLEQARELLHAHFSQNLTLDGIAKTVGTHPVHLARVFRHYHHCTLGEYVRKLRVEFACRELATTDASLTEIALAAGFYDQSHFSRTFKKIVGVTPTAYRALLRPR